MDSMQSWPQANMACRYYNIHTELSLADVSIVSCTCNHLQNLIY